MKFIRTVALASLFYALTLSLGGCTSGDEGAVEDLTPEEQANIEELREGYSNSGRYGPGGQNEPPTKPAAGEGDQSTE